MAEINIEHMAQPLAENICGENQEYNPLYLEMEELAVGVPESVMGNDIISGKDPDWKKLYTNCMELWKITRDLRVAVYLTLSLSQINGLQGFNDGLKLIHFLIADLWDDFYPKLDADDNNDPTERLNILQIISPSISSGNDAFTFLRTFRKIKLFENKKYTLRDLLIYQGEISTDDVFDNSLFNAEMISEPADLVDEKVNIIKDILATLDNIENTLNEKIVESYSFSFECLRKELSIFLKFYTKLSAGNEEQNSKNIIEDNEIGDTVDSGSKAAGVIDIENYKPRNRSEALLLVKKSADYFREVEPTNPVPYLLDRVLRIADKSFIDILMDIDPGAVDRIKEQLGLPRE